MEESHMTSFKQSPDDQYDIVQKLYAELEQEREASATAASATLSMILRLQGEKAVEKMEACQYKRMAEEKIRHAEESMAMFEDVLYHKDMEIASLKFQVQIYRDRFSKTSTSSPILIDIDSSKSPSLSRTNAFMSNMSCYENTIGKFTLPVMRSADKCSEMDIINGQVFSPPERRPNPEYFSKLINTMNDAENARGLDNTSDLPDESPVSDCIFHCDHVEDKSMTMKETSNSRRIEEVLGSDCLLAHTGFQMSMPTGSLSLGLGNGPYSSYSTASSDPFYDSTVEKTETLLGTEGIPSSAPSQSEYLENLQNVDSHCHPCLENELPIDTICSARFHDIFEVPQYAKDCNNEQKNKLLEDCFPERKYAPWMTCSLPNKARDDSCKDEVQLNNALFNGQYGTVLSAPRKGVYLDYNQAYMDHKSGVSLPQNTEALLQADVKQLKKRLQVLEDDRRIIKQEDSERGEEQLKLLRGISEQLSMIQSQIKRPPLKRCSYVDDTSVVSVMEAMLSFSV